MEQINEALVLRLVTEFQGFVRDLLDLGTIRLVRSAGCLPQYQAQLIAAATRDRRIDRGNPHLDAIAMDTSRLGVSQVRQGMQQRNPYHADDVRVLQGLVEMRNALAHADQEKVLTLASQGIRPTPRYIGTSQVVLSRHARALDHVVWDHLVSLFPTDHPWSP